VVVAKGSDKRIFSKEKKEFVMTQGGGAFNGILEYKNSYESANILDEWRREFIDDSGKVSGIVIAKSYECKPYGIKTGTPLSEALHMCPNLIVLPSDHLFYVELSQKLKAYLELRIPLLETYSIDEYFGDLDGWIRDEDTLEFITRLRDDILREFDLPITIAASKSKWIAKLLTDTVKPFGVIALPQESVAAFTDDIDVNDFPGVGRAISKRLDYYKVKTLGELRYRPDLLHSYGKSGRDLYARVCGTDNERVIPYSDRRGIGISRNFKAILERDEIYRRVMILARYLSHTISRLSLNPTTFYFKIRYEYGIKSSQSITLNRLFNERLLIDLAKSMIQRLDKHLGHKIHYIAMSASNFAGKNNYKTFNIIEHERDMKLASLSEKLSCVREKYGVDIVRYGAECR
jgi:DNA polymerase-4